MKTGIYCYLIADMLTEVLQKCSLSGPLRSMNFVQICEFDWLPWQLKCLICEKILKNLLLRSYKGDEAETL